MKRILCFGDSNTWGYISGSDHQRYNENERWTKLLQKKLGKEYEVIEEGLNSRTFFSVDTRPGKEGRVGFDYLKPCLFTHDKIDIFVLMLGTNELKTSYGNSPEDILEMLKKFIVFIRTFKSQIDGSSPELIVSGIPPVNEFTNVSDESNKYKGAGEKSKVVSMLFKNYCNENNIFYIDNDDLETGVDGIHITKESHKILSIRLSNLIKNIL